MNKDFLCTYKDEKMHVYCNNKTVKERPMVYVVSRYAGDVKTNREKAIEYCRYVIKRQRIPVASHLLYPQNLDDNDPEQRKLGMLFGLALLAVCKEVWVFGKPYSPGMQAEIDEAKRLGMKIRYFTEGMDELK